MVDIDSSFKHDRPMQQATQNAVFFSPKMTVKLLTVLLGVVLVR